MISQGLIQAYKYISFEEWVEAGFENEAGRVEKMFRSLKFGIIQPDRFKERRLLLPVEAIKTVNMMHPVTGKFLNIETGSTVEFDLTAQKFVKSELPEVSACRLLLPKGKR
jgi:hypothetical protein